MVVGLVKVSHTELLYEYIAVVHALEILFREDVVGVFLLIGQGSTALSHNSGIHIIVGLHVRELVVNDLKQSLEVLYSGRAGETGVIRLQRI